jgi:excisionase family DNA binding protein
MVNEAISIEHISIEPRDAPGLQALGRVLRLGPAKLVGPAGDNAMLPEPLHVLLKDIIKSLAAGHSLRLLPEEKQLTTQQAGEFLGMSRPYLIRLLNAGEIPYSLVGRHRRIALRDVLVYAKRRAGARKSALDRMARDAWDSGLYDNAAIPEGGRDE